MARNQSELELERPLWKVIVHPARVGRFTAELYLDTTQEEKAWAVCINDPEFKGRKRRYTNWLRAKRAFDALPERFYYSTDGWVISEEEYLSLPDRERI